MKNLLLLLIIFCLVSITGCRKENFNKKCSELSDAMQADNVSDAGNAITWFINKLPSKTYNEENLNKLVASLPGNCSYSATLICFSCIQTLPEQSEIMITYNSGSSTHQKIFDISYTADNKMKFVNMHN